MNQRELARHLNAFWGRAMRSSTDQNQIGAGKRKLPQRSLVSMWRQSPVKPALLVGLGLTLFSGSACTNPNTSETTLVADIRAIVSGGRNGGFDNSLSGNYLAGLHAVQIGDIRSAADTFEAALQRDPDNLELRRQIFVLHLTAGDFEAALEDAESLHETDPDLETASLLLALNAARDGDFDDASDRIEALDERGAIGVIRPLLLAWALFGAGDTDSALVKLEASDNEGLADKAAYYRGVIEALSDRLEAANSTFDGLLVADNGNRLPLLEAWAGVQQKLGRPEVIAPRIEAEPEAVRNNGRIQELLAQAGAGDAIAMPVASATQGMADTLFTLALFFDQQDIAPEAMRFARLASFLERDDGSIWLEVGRLALQMENPEEAIRAFDQIDEESPYYWEAQRAGALALYDLERLDEALAALRELSEERPQDLDAVTALGDLLRREQRFEEASEAYSEAIGRLDTAVEDDWRLFYNRGIAYERTDRWPEAESDFLKALELSPDQPFILNYLGYSWVDQGLNLDRAQAMLHKAVDTRPNDGFIVDSLGWAYYRLGDFEKSVDYLERAVELEPGDPVLNDHLGDAYWRVGRIREARYQWDRALSLEPEEEDIVEIEAKLVNGLPDEGGADRG